MISKIDEYDVIGKNRNITPLLVFETPRLDHYACTGISSCKCAMDYCVFFVSLLVDIASRCCLLSSVSEYILLAHGFPSFGNIDNVRSQGLLLQLEKNSLFAHDHGCY
jgi:hypothetical protein